MITFGWFCLLWFILFISISIFIGFKIDSDLAISTFVISFLISVVTFMWCIFSYDLTRIELSNTVVGEEKLILSLSDSSNTNINGKIAGNMLFTYGQIQSKTDTFYRTIAGDN